MDHRHLAQGIVGARNNVRGVGRICGQDSSQRGAKVCEEAAGVVCQPPRHLQEVVTFFFCGAQGVHWSGGSTAAAQQSQQPVPLRVYIT